MREEDLRSGRDAMAASSAWRGSRDAYLFFILYLYIYVYIALYI